MPPVIRFKIPDWANPDNASVLDSPLQKAARTIGSFLGINDPQSQIMGLAIAPIDVPAGPAQTIRAFHGSPHDFERFDASKIGTGEGAQAYGHGLYFAESEGTGRNYMASLARTPDVSVSGESVPLPKSAFDQQSARQTVANRLALQKKALRQLGWEDSEATSQAISQTEANINSALDSAVARGDEPVRQSLARQKAELGLMKEQGINIGPTGRLYEVNIHASPDELLDWDKPLSQQPQKVQEAIQKAAGYTIEQGKTGNWLIKVNDQVVGGSNTREQAVKNAQEMMKDLNDLPGQVLYHRMSGAYGRVGGLPAGGASPTAAQALKDAGIKGIQYLDQGSRASGEGTRNFVIFDDKIIEIAKKYGISLPAAASLYKTWQQYGAPDEKGVK